MDIVYYPTSEAVHATTESGEPLLVLIRFDGSETLVGPADEAVEHHILLHRMGRNSLDLDKYFRIVLDDEGADWTFVCPPDYREMRDKQKRIEAFYKDGFVMIAQALHALGYLVGINIPRRYRRHFDMMGG